MGRRVLYLLTTTDRAESHSIVEMAARGVEATVVCEPDAPMRGFFEAAGLRTIPLPMRSKLDWKAVRALRRLRREQDFDIVHVYYKKALCLYNLAAVGLPRVPVVAYRGIIGNLSYWDPYSWLSFLDKRFLLVFRLFHPQRVVTIHKGHHTGWYRQESPRIPADLQVPQGAVVIGCVARLKRRKGIVELIRAFERIPGGSGAYLLLVGSVEYPAIEQAVAASPARERIRLTGFRQDAAQLAGAFDIVTLPSLRREGLPRAVIEAMSQGIPPVVSDSGGNPELVTDRVSGRVLPAGDVDALYRALRELVDNPEERRLLGERARETIEQHFTVASTAGRTLEEYQALVPLQRDR